MNLCFCFNTYALGKFDGFALVKLANVFFLFFTVRPQFTIVPANTSALIGSDVSLACVARGDPPPEISWKLVRGTLPLKRAHFDEERLLISNVSEHDAGTYICMAENKAGSIEAAATVTVLCKIFSLYLLRFLH